MNPMSLLLCAMLLLCFALTATEIVAHRGASIAAPENTIAAAKLAYEQGANNVECDIFVTKDGKLAVCHDQNTKRTTGVDGDLEKMTMEEVKALDAAATFKDKKYAGEKIPTLDELLAVVPNGKRLMIEIKTGLAAVRPALKAALDASGKKSEQIQIISFNYAMLQAVKKEMPQYEVLLLASNKRDKEGKQLTSIDDLISKTKAAGLDGLSLSREWPFDAEFVKKIKDAGLKVYVWTINDVAEAKRMAESGVTGVCTDKPKMITAN